MLSPVLNKQPVIANSYLYFRSSKGESLVMTQTVLKVAGHLLKYCSEDLKVWPTSIVPRFYSEKNF